MKADKTCPDGIANGREHDHLTEQLRRDVTVLASDIGERNVWLPEKLDTAVRFEEQTLSALGYRVQRQGYRALSVTDTAFLRYKHYHAVDDTPEKLDYAKMAVVVGALIRAVSVIVEDGQRKA